MARKRKVESDGFVRKTVTIPRELARFAEDRARAPEHAGNLSSYVRKRILEDRQALKTAA